MSAWLAPLHPDVVWFIGPDALRFLNDLISQEIGDLMVGESRRSMLLGPDGKVDHLLWVIRSEAGYGLVTDPGRGPALVATLGRYRIRVDVDITQEKDPVWLVMGDGDGYDVSWSTQPRRLVIGEKPDLAEGGQEDYERARIEAGEPEFGREIDRSTIPHETGLVAATVDFGKGCFLGQELVGRIEARGGNAPRPVRRVFGADPLPLGPLFGPDGSEKGRVTSAVGRHGLAIVKRSVEPGSALYIDGVEVSVEEIAPKPQT